MRRKRAGRFNGLTGNRALFLICAVSAMALLVSCSQWDYMTGRAPAGGTTISPKVTEQDLERLVDSIRPIGGNPDSQYRLAMHYQERDRHEEALKTFWKAVSIDPEYVNAFIGMGISYDATGRYSRAQQAYRLALKVDPGSDFALNNLGYSCFLQGRFECAVEALEEAVALNPEKKRYRNNLGRAYLEVGEYGEAYGQFNLGMEEAKANFLMGHFLYEKRMYGEAGTYFARALAVDPGMKGARKGLEAARALAEITEPEVRKTEEPEAVRAVVQEEVLKDEMSGRDLTAAGETPAVLETSTPATVEESAVNAEAAASSPLGTPAGTAVLKETERVGEMNVSAGEPKELPSTEGSVGVTVSVQASAAAASAPQAPGAGVGMHREALALTAAAQAPPASPASHGAIHVPGSGRAIGAEGRIPEDATSASTSIEIQGTPLSAEGESEGAAAEVTAVLSPAEEKVLNALPVREEPAVTEQEPVVVAVDLPEAVENTPAAAQELAAAEPAVTSLTDEQVASALHETEEAAVTEQEPVAAIEVLPEVVENTADDTAQELAEVDLPEAVETADRGDGEKGQQTSPSTPSGKQDDEFVLVRCHVKQSDDTAVTVLQFMRLSTYLDTVRIEIVGSRGAGSLATEMQEYLRALGYGKVTFLGEGEKAHSKTKVYYSDEYLQPAFRVAKDIPGYQEMESTQEPSVAGTTIRIVVGSDMKSHAGIFRQREKFAYSVSR